MYTLHSFQLLKEKVAGDFDNTQNVHRPKGCYNLLFVKPT